MKKKTEQKDIEDLIKEALKKVGGKKESALCPYLPSDTEGHMHHFTLKRLKSSDPSKLRKMIQRYILKGRPRQIAPAPRVRRGSRSSKVNLTTKDLNRLMELARSAGDDELTAKLAPSRSFTSIKREFLASIRANQADDNLWEGYRIALAKAPRKQSVA